MNNMCGIESAGSFSDSCAHTGRGDLFATDTQGIVLTHSALGWVLMAFQAIPRVTV
jgi:hypothetical protein